MKVVQIPMTKADLFLGIFEAIPGTLKRFRMSLSSPEAPYGEFLIILGLGSTKEASAEERISMCAEKHESRCLLFPDWMHSLVSSNQHGVLTA